MLLIIAHHFSLYSKIEFTADTVILNSLWMHFLTSGGKIGVNIFVLISGYFLISSKSLKIDKIIKLWLQIFTYSISIYIIFIFINGQISVKNLIKSFLPICFLSGGSQVHILYYIY